MKATHSFVIPLVSALVAAACLTIAAPAAGAGIGVPLASGDSYVPPGEAPAPINASDPYVASMLTRAEVGTDVRAAAARGELVAAGEGVLPNETFGRSAVSRAMVKQATLQARLDDSLIPSGEGVWPVERVARRSQASGQRLAAHQPR